MDILLEGVTLGCAQAHLAHPVAPPMVLSVITRLCCRTAEQENVAVVRGQTRQVFRLYRRFHSKCNPDYRTAVFVSFGNVSWE
jgi:hypothetical protein